MCATGWEKPSVAVCIIGPGKGGDFILSSINI